MAKFSGKIGFAVTSEKTINGSGTGVWEEHIVERQYYGDLIRNSRRLQADKLNDSITISNDISIVADPYAYENFHSIRYVIFMGTKWKVDSVDVDYPRLSLSLGGVYNA